ncbi:hypothetical protein [Actinomadura coerulea]
MNQIRSLSTMATVAIGASQLRAAREAMVSNVASGGVSRIR